ncbi:phosphopantetheine-binding protein [Paenibacillus larvae]|uniref:phosphopantetheine-binding protein n=1 Tax=Paenibacillus larvae TaxID=1464 RepID=UPI00384B3E51
MENLPLTPNGKIDQKALRNLAEQEDAVVVHDEPANELEERIASVWRDVLGVEKVDVNDDFYQHGGNSLLIIKLEVELEKGDYLNPVLICLNTIRSANWLYACKRIKMMCGKRNIFST